TVGSPTEGRSARSASPAAGNGISKVLTIVEENHSLAQMRSGMPHLYRLAQRYGYATHYQALSHPSLPNYLAIAGGSTFGVSDDAAPASHPLHGTSVFGQALATGQSARLYAESMPAPCSTSSHAPYAVKHAPWAYFLDERAACTAGMVPAGTPTAGPLAADIATGRLPTVGMLIPSLDNDAHDGSLARADTWLRHWLDLLLAGPDFASGALAIVVTADEDDRSAGNTVLTVVLAQGIRDTVVTRPLSHYSLTRFYDDVIGAAPLREAARATSLGAAFSLHPARH
ncbi:MAG: alkaline phosphatase family protein, partial [Pseudonocardiales bacterium]